MVTLIDLDVLVFLNGFLGHIVCLNWLEELSKVDGKLICIIRAVDKETAKKRLDKKFKGVDTAFENRYNELSAQHLEVLAGDISEPLLGLNEANKKNILRITKNIRK